MNQQYMLFSTPRLNSKVGHTSYDAIQVVVSADTLMARIYPF